MIDQLLRYTAKKKHKPAKKHTVHKRRLDSKQYYQPFQSPLPGTAGAPRPTRKEFVYYVVEKMEFGSGVKQVVRYETEQLLRNKNPSSVYDLALALETSKVLADAVDLDGNIDALDGSGDTNKDGKDVFVVLRKLQTKASAFSNTVTCWEDAEAVLKEEQVFFREETQQQQETKSLAAFAMQIKQNANKLMRRFRIRGFQASSRPMLEVVHFESAGEEIKAMEAKEEAEYQSQLHASNERRKPALVREAEEKARLEEKAAEAREIASSLLRPLDAEEQEIVNDAMYGTGSPTDLLAQVDNDTVLRESMHRLQPGQWLNDEVIHYFLIMLAKRDEEKSKADPNRARSHFFKSYFMTKLLNEGHADPSVDGTYEYRNVKRWSKKVAGKDLFKLDKIVFPINQGNAHWVCAVAFMKEKRIQMYDSMGGRGGMYLESIFQYLQDEHKDKKKEPMPDIDSWELVPTQPDTPHQRNGYDCGVFTCMFADFLSNDCPLVFNQEHITQCRERIALSIMMGTALM